MNWSRGIDSTFVRCCCDIASPVSSLIGLTFSQTTMMKSTVLKSFSRTACVMQADVRLTTATTLYSRRSRAAVFPEGTTPRRSTEVRPNLIITGNGFLC
jgi:hypothetical protein